VKTGIDVREWAPDEPDPRLLVDQGDAGKLARPGLDPVVLAGPVVRGVPAIQELVRVADGLRGWTAIGKPCPGRLPRPTIILT
jgi:hypothetical protein